jgi:hypothetical protein
VPLFWFEVKETPYAFRREVMVGQGLRWAAAEARSSGYLYAFVDGRLAYSYGPKEGEKADTSLTHRLDLTPFLTPGRHALVVSAPAEGFSLDGMLRYSGRAEPLQTDAAWRVRRYAPTTILEDQSWLRLGGGQEGAPVALREAPAGGSGVPESRLLRLVAASRAQRAVALYDDTVWRLGLLTRRGLVLHGASAYGALYKARLNPGALRATLTSLSASLAPRSPIGVWVASLRGREAQATGPQAINLLTQVEAQSARMALLSQRLWLLDEVKAQKLAGRLVHAYGRVSLPPGISAERVGAAAGMAELQSLEARLSTRRRALERVLGGTLNVLNESRRDRLGWLPHPDLVDGQLRSWGLYAGPMESRPYVLPEQMEWRFSPDPGDQGEGEKRQTMGYNAESQWPRVKVPASRTTYPGASGYRGTAWYRARFQVPEEWNGHPVEVRFQAAGRWRAWLNDQFTEDTPGSKGHTLTFAPQAVRYGAQNVLALEVREPGANPGLFGSFEVRCPDLMVDRRAIVPEAEVTSTPLSPAVILTPTEHGQPGSTIHLYGWAERHQPGPSAILLPMAGRDSGHPKLLSVGKGGSYRPTVHGRMSQNWALVWMKAKDGKSPDRPLLLVFEKQPTEIGIHDGFISISLGAPGSRVVAVRPWVRQVPEPESPAIWRGIDFWRRAALRVPVGYVEVTRTVKPGPPPGFQFGVTNVPSGPTLSHEIVYDYVALKDEWGTRPLTVAPLPALASYGMDCHFRGLDLKGARPEVAQDGGLLAPYRVVRGADRVAYSYPIEPYPRLTGFTSWMFSYADSGVPGNAREVEVLATTGANTYRPQHNFGTEVSPFYGPNSRRTRVEVLADYCRKAGMNYMNNIDQTLGDDRKVVQQDYPAFMERVTRHYEGIARQLRAWPFLDVAYDLVNEPFDHQHGPYNEAMKTLTARVRAIDPTHLLYVEPCEAWGAIEQLKLIEPTGDPLTLYSFHDYNFRLFKPSDRWPTVNQDLSSICRKWTEAFRFAIQHGTGMHCGEFGGFDRSTDGELAQLTLMNDFFRVFDQFGMHSNYYPGRELFGRRADGSLALSNVVRAYRAYTKANPLVHPVG